MAGDVVRYSAEIIAMRVGIVRTALISVLSAAVVQPVSAAGWAVQQNEQDPFDKSRSSFVAMTISGTTALGIRCLEGSISLVLVTGPSNSEAGESVDLKIVADGKEVQEETAGVLNTTNMFTSIQFGDEETLRYFDGTQKLSVRYTLGASTSTVSFSGGKSLADVIGKARKACGIDTSPPKPSTANDKAAQSTAIPPAGETCEAQFGRMKKAGDLGPDPDEAGFLKWCATQSAKP